MSPKSNSMPAFPKISPLFPPLALRWVFGALNPGVLLIISISGRPHWPWKCQPRRGRDCHPEPRSRGRGGRGARGLHHEQPRRRGEIPTTKLSTGSKVSKTFSSWGGETPTKFNLASCLKLSLLAGTCWDGAPCRASTSPGETDK